LFTLYFDYYYVSADWWLVSTQPDCTRLFVACSGSRQHCWWVVIAEIWGL